MDSWIALTIVIIVFAFIISIFTTFRKNAKTPLREKSLNELKETLPRDNKTQHKMKTIPKK
jgi:hypothetical protein